VLTQLEKYFKEKETKKEVKYDSFNGDKLNNMNMNLSEKTMDRILYTVIYSSFLMNYFSM
tara:strand:- start:860 stop:1039 length:180 start_codon:yes stop_codon:yes gene_type:complete